MSAANANFSGNSALSVPAIYSDGSFLEVFNSRFEYNDGLLAAIFLAKNSTAVLHDCKYIGNLCSAIFVWISSNLTITKSIFQNHFVGPAITMFNNSVLLITNSTFRNNSATPLNHDKILQLQNSDLEKPDSSGGAILMIDSSGTLIQCNFLQGYATIGGALTLMNSSLSIQNTVFENNVAVESGGAIESLSDVNVTIENSKFKNNTVQDQLNGYGGANRHEQLFKCHHSRKLVLMTTRSVTGGAIYIGTLSVVFNKSQKLYSDSL